MKGLISKAKKLFFKGEQKEIFGHNATGESCPVCGKKMLTKQGITMVGSGEKMHSKCWPEFFKMEIGDITTKFNGANHE